MPAANKCIVKFQDTLSPVSGTFRGIRILAATPNRAARTFAGDPCPSFDKLYLISVFGDYCDTADLLAHFDRCVSTLRRMGYSTIDIV